MSDTPKVPDDISGVFAIPHDPELDEAMENWTPMMQLIGDIYAKAIACGVPPGLAEKIVFEYMRGIAPALFNAPHAILMTPFFPPTGN